MNFILGVIFLGLAFVWILRAIANGVSSSTVTSPSVGPVSTASPVSIKSSVSSQPLKVTPARVESPLPVDEDPISTLFINGDNGGDPPPPPKSEPPRRKTPKVKKEVLPIEKWPENTAETPKKSLTKYKGRDPIIKMFPAVGPREGVLIVGNPQGLQSLRDLIDEVLNTNKMGHRDIAESDGMPYPLRVMSLNEGLGGDAWDHFPSHYVGGSEHETDPRWANVKAMFDQK